MLSYLGEMRHFKTYFWKELSVVNEYLTSYTVIKFLLIFSEKNRIASKTALIVHMFAYTPRFASMGGSALPNPPELGLHLSRPLTSTDGVVLLVFELVTLLFLILYFILFIYIPNSAAMGATGKPLRLHLYPSLRMLTHCERSGVERSGEEYTGRRRRGIHKQAEQSSAIYQSL